MNMVEAVVEPTAGAPAGIAGETPAAAPGKVSAEATGADQTSEARVGIL